MKPDSVDNMILQALMDDGRASYRQIAQRTSLTTPTVSARMARMVKAGLIKKFVPVLSPQSINRGVLALVTLRVNSGSIAKVAGEIAKLPRVEDLYITTGQNVTFKVVLDDVHDLQSFLKQRIFVGSGVQVTSSQVVTEVVKEEMPSHFSGTLTMSLRCDYCKGEVTSSRPYTVSAGSSHYYFCCRTCRRAYLDKNGSKLAKIGHRRQNQALHS